ncbi:hypothetical protein M758_11G085300 [Ceratodon purpureus]|nr:hypothetical protein M758_11G085300 [Ceratodon purpureus]
MEELFVTAHESPNLSEDPQSSASREPSLEHGDSRKTNILPSPSSSSSVYYSARTESMIENKSKFSSELEMSIEYSKVHWSELAETDEDEEYSPEANLMHFERLKAHPRIWGEFFRDFDSLVVGEKIGEGAQAEIYAATLSGLYECAVKVFKEGYALRGLQQQWPEGMLKSYKEKIFFIPKPTRMPKKEFSTTYSNPKFIMNINNLYSTNTRQILQCIYGGTLLKEERFKNRFAFVMKRQWGGDLRNLIDARMLKNHNQGPPFPPHNASELMSDIAWDIKELHQEFGIIHRDLKASNVLLPHPDAGSVDLFDYNLCPTPSFSSCSYPVISVVLADYECSLGVVGTAFWRAPEILQQLKDKVPSSKMKFSYEADIYSFGMLCYEIITGCIPFENHSTIDYDFVLNGARPELPHDVEPCVRNVITECWHLDPFQRPHISDIIHRLGNVSRSTMSPRENVWI